MNGLKSLWAVVQGDPVFMRRVNGWLAIFWVIMIPVGLWAGWLDSVVYVSALSLWALVSGHWSAWQAARVEVKQDEDEDKLENLIDDLIEALVERTNLEQSVTQKLKDDNMRKDKAVDKED